MRNDYGIGLGWVEERLAIERARQDGFNWSQMTDAARADYLNLVVGSGSVGSGSGW